MRALCLVLSIIIIVGACSDPHAGDVDEIATNEPPFFSADKNGVGPLTLAELQINIPRKIDQTLSDRERACFLERVADRAYEAGDPAYIDPNDFEYWGGEVDMDQWGQFSNHMKRVLLAQGIVSWAMQDC